MVFSSDPRWSEALAQLPDYLGNHVRVSVTAAGARTPLVSLPLAIFSRMPHHARGAARACQIVQTVPAWRYWGCFYPLLLALAHCHWHGSGLAFSV